MSTHPSLAVVLPAYNEAERIGPALDELFGYLHRRGEQAVTGSPGRPPPRRHRVLVVDDGSTDATAALVRARPEANGSRPDGTSLALLRVPHGGKGAAVRAGMLAATGDLVIFADADMATPPDQLPLLVAALADHDVALGSRIQPDGSDMRDEPAGATGGSLGRGLPRAGLGRGSSGPSQDTQCGFKGFTREVAHDLFAAQQITQHRVRRRAHLPRPAARLPARRSCPIHWADRRGSRMRPGPASRCASPGTSSGSRCSTAHGVRGAAHRGLTDPAD